MAQGSFSLSCPALDDAALVGFKGTEQISRPYEIEVYFTLPSGTDTRKAVGERATLKVTPQDDSPPLVLHGVIASVRLLHHTGERALYHALLVPKLWFLRHFWRSFVFTYQNVQAFLTATLKDGGLGGNEFRFSINDGGYPTEEFVAQYRETHLDFFHRWLEREGLYYYFEHPAEGENEVLVIVDDLSLHEDFPGSGRVRYYPVLGDAAVAKMTLSHLEQDVQWLPKSVTIADYNYGNPNVLVKGESNVTQNGVGAIRDYGYRVFVQSDAARLAEVRAQAIGCREVTLRAGGNVLGPRAGYRLSLDDQPDDVGEKWLAIEVQHMASIGGITAEMQRLTGLSGIDTYRIKLIGIPSDVQFRAAQTTPWPRIYGFENAVVGGPADSQYAQIDSDGRYLVRFEFDTSGLPDARISTRVRMMQPHGGDTEGFHFPLRKGTEVMIAFLGGDCDRPFIAGVVPNAHRPSVVAERNHSQNIIRTGSGNQMVLEDEQGKEFIFLHTPNNRTGVYMGFPSGNHGSVYTGDGETQTGTFSSPANANPANPNVEIVRDVEFSYLETTEGSGGSWIGGDSWENVGVDKYSFVKNDSWGGIGGTWTFEVGSDSTETYYAKRFTTIKKGREDTVEAGGMKQTITGGMKLTVNDGMTHDVHGGLTQTIEPKGSSTVTGPWTHKVTALAHDDYKDWQTDVAQKWTGTFGSDVALTSATSFKIKAPMAKVTATDLKWEILGLTFDISPNKHELYVYKGASGVIKTDHAVLAQSTTAVKFDSAGLKIDFTLVKMENYPVYAGKYGAKLRNQMIGMIIGAMLAHNVAFTKL